MEKLKIAITRTGSDAATDALVRQICEDPVIVELCTPAFYEEEAAYRNLNEGKVDALVHFPSAEAVKCPAEATELIVTDQTRFMPLAKEPSAEDIVKFRDILERDFGLRSPRIAIVQETEMQNPDLASQVTEEHGINTYGPYTIERLLAEDAACHFDGIAVADKTLMQRLLTELSQQAPVRYFAGREAVVTAVCQPVRTKEKEEEEGLADISWLTHPFYIATDVIRNRTFYDEARQNPLPKLYRDKREDRKTEKDTPKVSNEDRSNP